MQRKFHLQALACLITMAGAAPAQPPAGPGGMPPLTNPNVSFTAALLVKDGSTQLDATTTSGAGAKKVSAAAASGLAIKSSADLYNGLLVRGKSEFTLKDSKIELSGKGKSDFDGIAAGALVKDEATLVLRKVRIHTRGIVSTAATATDKTVMKVYNSTLIADGGPTPSGYVRRIGPGMMEPPTPLGIVGTARTSLTMGEARSYFYDSTIIADGWGALSTDAARGAYLEANRCDIRVLRSGYGVYADHGAAVVVNDSKMQVATFGGIIAGEASIAFNNLQAVSDGNLVMIHSVMGQPSEKATLSIKGGKISTRNAAIVVKSANADISIDGARIKAVNGDLLLAVINDDGFATKVNGALVSGINAELRNAALEGNVLNLDTERRMSVRLVATSLKGAVRDAALSLDAGSRWTATADSKLLLVKPTTLEQIDAPAGVSIDAMAEPEVAAKGSYRLASGGVLTVH
jgi:hypothetical protein